MVPSSCEERLFTLNPNSQSEFTDRIGVRMGLRMRVHDREPIGAALRRFKKLIERSGMKGELRAHEYYEKPCEARRRKEARRKNAIRKAASMPRS